MCGMQWYIFHLHSVCVFPCPPLIYLIQSCHMHVDVIIHVVIIISCKPTETWIVVQQTEKT